MTEADRVRYEVMDRLENLRIKLLTRDKIEMADISPLVEELRICRNRLLQAMELEEHPF